MHDLERFDDLQKKVNEKYYRKRGRKIYSDFKTFGSSDKIAIANAIDFFGWLVKNDDGSEITAYDFGIGNGLFSKFFLKKLYELDKKREYVKRLGYFLCDISEELLEKAENEMKEYQIDTILCDANGSLDFTNNAAYVRSNEMYDDLPARIFIRKKDGIKEVIMNEKMKKEYISTEIDDETKQFMKMMPIEYEIPINFAARKHLDKCVKNLRDEGYVDIFDYGFSSIEEMKKMPWEMWNNAIVREFNTQLTIDVNFVHLALGHNAKINTQKDYAEKTIGQKLHYVEMDQLYYFDENEVRKNLKKMSKFGYSRDFLDSGIKEVDDYKHLRIWKK